MKVIHFKPLAEADLLLLFKLHKLSYHISIYLLC
jgi:hypothetical protein